ncbi:hypothetical protein BJV74DRAFT_546556 [Russula compacta]|nr:hypothetical protein BJV74DRAFT_546556 [Russula compacta]
MGSRGIVYFIFRRPRFCCCLPVRVCVIIMSLLAIFLSGILSLVLWFEVSRGDALTSKERGSFIGGAIVETLFFLISVVGLIGAIVRKLTFVTPYAIGLYIHFLVNFSVAMYLLFAILHSTRTDTVVLCQHVLSNAQSQGQCDSIFGAIRGVYAVLASLILVVELYCAIVATRYVYQLRREKRHARMPRHKRAESGSRPLLPGFVRYKEASGTMLYHSYYYPATKDFAHHTSTPSLASSELGSGTVVESDDPPNTGPLLGTSFGPSDSEDEYSDDDQSDHTYRDHDHDHALGSQETVVLTPPLHHGD